MNHKDLDAWKLSMDLVEQVYSITSSFPSEEKFGLTNQLRRASVSVPSNISEGAARKSNKEMIQFLYISLGSLSELETQLLISKRLGYVKQMDVLNKIVEVRKPIIGLIKYLNNQLK